MRKKYKPKYPVKHLYGWDKECDSALTEIWARLTKEGLPFTYNEKPNMSAILIYILKREALK